MIKFNCAILLIFYQSHYLTNGELSYEKPLYSYNTPYQWQFDSTGPVDEAEFVRVRTPDLQTCTPAFFSFIARHGTRYPPSRGIKKFSALHQKLMAVVPPINDDELRGWTNKYLADDALKLTLLGEMEFRNLGQRFGMRFRFLFSRSSKCEFNAIESDQARTQNSALAFFNGFMRVVKGVRMNPSCFKLNVRNDITHFYTLCAKYDKYVRGNATAVREKNEFADGLLMKKLATDISMKLTKKNDVLNTHDVFIMYGLCANDLAIFRSATWCKVFESEEQLRILEYLDDLRLYWEMFIGYEITYKQSCPLVRDIFQHIDEAVSKSRNNVSYDGGYFQFSHGETVGPLLGALGLYNDTEPPTARNYEEQRNRTFRSSYLFASASHVAFVLYRCPLSPSEYFLKVFVNERPVRLPACDKELCPYDTVRQTMKAYIDDCDFDNVCDNK